MATRPTFPGTTGPKIESGRRTNECRGRADEHPAVLDAGLVRTHANDRHPDAERGVDVPRRERRSHLRVAAADLLLVQDRVRETVERLVAEHEPDVRRHACGGEPQQLPQQLALPDRLFG